MGQINTSAVSIGSSRAAKTSGELITADDLRRTLAVLSTFTSHTHTITDTYATNCQCDCQCRCNCFGNGCNLN